MKGYKLFLIQMLVVLVLTAIFCLILYFPIQIYKSNWSRNLLENGVKTTGIVDVHGYRIKIRYDVNGKELISKYRDKPYRGIQSGEKFLVRYNKDNPTNFGIYYRNPIIDRELFDTVECTKIEYYFDGAVVFFYDVDVFEYEKVQDVGTNLDYEAYPELHYVLYKKDNPSIAYVFLDTLKARELNLK